MLGTHYGRLTVKRMANLFIVITASTLIGCGSSSSEGSSGGGNTTPSNTLASADAGPDQSVITNTLVTLDANASFDADGDTLSYSWSITSSPSSTVSLSNATSATAHFTPDVDGSYIISLVVNDGSENSLADAVTITSSTSGTSYSYAIVDTNQSLCYDSTSGVATACSGIGYDADINGNQPSYTLSDDGLSVTDNVTGLIWQQSTDLNADGIVDYDDKLFQEEAVSYCENLTLAGREDWRLPSVKEAYSLILFSGKDASNYAGTDTSTLTPFIDPVFDWAFGDLDSGNDRIIDGQYASSTLYVSTTMNNNATVFGVNYVDGRIKGYPLATKEYYVRCVTGNSDYGNNDYLDNNDQTISDRATGLMWQKNDTESLDWDDAIAQCESATTADYDDWRLPNAKELHSLVDYTVSPDTDDQASIDAVFNSSSFTNEEGEIDWGYYWSTTTHVSNTDDGSNAVYVSFGRALGYMLESILDVHGAGSQRSNDKLDVATEPGASEIEGVNGTFYYKGPQGDILRVNNKVRCVRDDSADTDVEKQQYTLFAPLKSTETYLINELGETVHTWESDYRPALSVYLLDNGELLRTASGSDLPEQFTNESINGSGLVEILDWQSNVVWSTTIATDSYLSHHDVEQLPNGNILAVVWESKTAAEALALGRTKTSADTLWADAVYEICRASASNTCTDGEVVWKWSTWDHVIQDVDSSITSTYVSDISANSDKVDLNYFTGAGAADWTHVNSVDYNAEKDQILISVHNFDEYWIIDHSDASKGIIARVGNPAAHGATGEQTLFVQHDAQWIAEGLSGAGNILVFNNGSNRPDGDYSSVDEFCYQASCTEGEIVSSYSEGASGEFYADHISGAQRLANGNTLVCEGTEGRLFEYDSNHDITWEYNYDSEIFRALRYEEDYSGLAELQ